MTEGRWIVVYFGVPVYNEEQTIGLTLYKLKEIMEGVRRDFRIIALDDYSSDGTWERIQRYQKLLPLMAIRNDRNMGLGYCLRTIIQKVADESKFPDRDILVTVESDFTNDASTVPSMVRAIEEGMDVVIGSGLVKQGEVRAAPFKVRFTTALLHLMLRNLYAIEGVRDYLSMLRAYRIAVLKRLSGQFENGMLNFRTKAANTELLIRLSGLSRYITEVPCTQRYDIRSRPSRMRLVEMVSNHMRLITQHWSYRED